MMKPTIDTSSPKEDLQHNDMPKEQNPLLPDFTDIDEVRKAFIMSEILNKKY